ncbi:AglZ/HisF2 family acetamidino modification protein [soil metagenome]
MMQHRVIPCLLLRDDILVKTVGFRRPKYVGDPINAAKLFNDLEVDELIYIDINATVQAREPNYERIKEIVSECFMPVCYGGGITTIEQARSMFKLGVEKVTVTTAAVENPVLVRDMSREFGKQSVIVGIDVKRDLLRRPRVRSRSGTNKTSLDPVKHAQHMEDCGAGEILLNSIDRDGSQRGYDLDLVRSVSGAVSIPVIACGGAGSLGDLAAAARAGASAVAAGSLFVFVGPHRAVLINYPSQELLHRTFQAPTPQ